MFRITAYVRELNWISIGHTIILKVIYIRMKDYCVQRRSLTNLNVLNICIETDIGEIIFSRCLALMCAYRYF